MTTLSIIITPRNPSITAVETEFGDNVRYVESFYNWNAMLATLGQFMDDYAWIEVKVEVN